MNKKNTEEKLPNVHRDLPFHYHKILIFLLFVSRVLDCERVSAWMLMKFMMKDDIRIVTKKKYKTRASSHHGRQWVEKIMLIVFLIQNKL